ncbi:MAG: hypothetical protein ACLFMO_08150 [Eubacteriales bacterium]
MYKIGKSSDGNIMYLTKEELKAIKEGREPFPDCNNQQKAKIRKIINRM